MPMKEVDTYITSFTKYRGVHRCSERHAKVSQKSVRIPKSCLHFKVEVSK